MWDVFLKKPRVLTWAPTDKHPYTKLHAKALIVDRIEMLVGSANFTFLGLESNLELGIRVRGPQAGAVAERFDHLLATRILTPWSPLG
jgi:phosphatidylserine/phosphatidylglycerophosphate/cardiolipin synthase-like enzyme